MLLISRFRLAMQGGRTLCSCSEFRARGTPDMVWSVEDDKCHALEASRWPKRYDERYPRNAQCDQSVAAISRQEPAIYMHFAMDLLRVQDSAEDPEGNQSQRSQRSYMGQGSPAALLVSRRQEGFNLCTNSVTLLSLPP